VGAVDVRRGVPSFFATNTWRPKAPFETYEQCRNDIKRHRDRAMIKEGPNAPARLHWNREAWRIDGIDYECWPDTVDPHGPKRK
jgi:hypothetical protein